MASAQPLNPPEVACLCDEAIVSCLPSVRTSSSLVLAIAEKLDVGFSSQPALLHFVSGVYRELPGLPSSQVMLQVIWLSKAVLSQASYAKSFMTVKAETPANLANSAELRASKMTKFPEGALINSRARLEDTLTDGISDVEGFYLRAVNFQEEAQPFASLGFLMNRRPLLLSSQTTSGNNVIENLYPIEHGATLSYHTSDGKKSFSGVFLYPARPNDSLADLSTAASLPLYRRPLIRSISVNPRVSSASMSPNSDHPVENFVMAGCLSFICTDAYGRQASISADLSRGLAPFHASPDFMSFDEKSDIYKHPCMVSLWTQASIPFTESLPSIAFRLQIDPGQFYFGKKLAAVDLDQHDHVDILGIKRVFMSSIADEKDSALEYLLCYGKTRASETYVLKFSAPNQPDVFVRIYRPGKNKPLVFKLDAESAQACYRATHAYPIVVYNGHYNAGFCSVDGDVHTPREFPVIEDSTLSLQHYETSVSYRLIRMTPVIMPALLSHDSDQEPRAPTILSLDAGSCIYATCDTFSDPSSITLAFEYHSLPRDEDSYIFRLDALPMMASRGAIHPTRQMMQRYKITRCSAQSPGLRVIVRTCDGKSKDLTLVGDSVSGVGAGDTVILTFLNALGKNIARKISFLYVQQMIDASRVSMPLVGCTQDGCTSPVYSYLVPHAVPSMDKLKEILNLHNLHIMKKPVVFVEYPIVNFLPASEMTEQHIRLAQVKCISDGQEFCQENVVVYGMADSAAAGASLASPPRPQAAAAAAETQETADIEVLEEEEDCFQDYMDVDQAVEPVAVITGRELREERLPAPAAAAAASEADDDEPEILASASAAKRKKRQRPDVQTDGLAADDDAFAAAAASALKRTKISDSPAVHWAVPVAKVVSSGNSESSSSSSARAAGARSNSSRAQRVVEPEPEPIPTADHSPMEVDDSVEDAPEVEPVGAPVPASQRPKFVSSRQSLVPATAAPAAATRPSKPRASAGASASAGGSARASANVQVVVPEAAPAKKPEKPRSVAVVVPAASDRAPEPEPEPKKPAISPLLLKSGSYGSTVHKILTSACSTKEKAKQMWAHLLPGLRNGNRSELLDVSDWKMITDFSGAKADIGHCKGYLLHRVRGKTVPGRLWQRHLTRGLSADEMTDFKALGLADVGLNALVQMVRSIEPQVRSCLSILESKDAEKAFLNRIKENYAHSDMRAVNIQWYRSEAQQARRPQYRGPDFEALMIDTVKEKYLDAYSNYYNAVDFWALLCCVTEEFAFNRLPFGCGSRARMVTFLLCYFVQVFDHIAPPSAKISDVVSLLEQALSPGVDFFDSAIDPHKFAVGLAMDFFDRSDASLHEYRPSEIVVHYAADEESDAAIRAYRAHNLHHADHKRKAKR